MSTVKCTLCGALLLTKAPSAPGKKLKCPKCQKVFVVGNAKQDTDEEPTAPTTYSANPKKTVDEDESSEAPKLMKPVVKGATQAEVEDDEAADNEERATKKKAKSAETATTKKPAGKSGLLIGIPALALLVCCGGVGTPLWIYRHQIDVPRMLGFRDGNVPPKAGDANANPDFTVNAEAITQELADAKAYQTKYKDKVLEVTGEVSSVAIDRIWLKGIPDPKTNYFKTVNCEVPRKLWDKSHVLALGQKIKVTGRADVSFAIVVDLRNCSFVELESAQLQKVTVEQIVKAMHAGGDVKTTENRLNDLLGKGATVSGTVDKVFSRSPNSSFQHRMQLNMPMKTRLTLEIEVPKSEMLPNVGQTIEFRPTSGFGYHSFDREFRLRGILLAVSGPEKKTDDGTTKKPIEPKNLPEFDPTLDAKIAMWEKSERGGLDAKVVASWERAFHPFGGDTLWWMTVTEQGSMAVDSKRNLKQYPKADVFVPTFSVKPENYQKLKDLPEPNVPFAVFTSGSFGSKKLSGLQELARFKQLKGLSLSEVIVDEAACSGLGELTQLQWLGISQSSIDEKSLNHLSKLSSLQLLTLRGGFNTSKLTGAGFAGIAKLPALEKVYLDNTMLNDAGMKALGMQTQIKELSLAKTKISGAGLKELETLKQLTKLDLSETKIKGGLKAVTSLENLEELKLDLAMINDADLNALGDAKQLRRLHVFSHDISDAALAGLRKIPTLRHLSISCFSFTDRGVKEIGALKDLETLRFGGGNITDQGAMELGSLHKLQELSFGGANVTDAGYKVLGKFPELKILRLSSEKITDVGMQELASLKKLEQLHLGRNPNVGDAGLKAVGRLSELVKLELFSEKTTDTGLQELAPLSKLEYLQLSSPLITDAGIKVVTKFPELRTLNVQCQKLTDNCVKDLATLQKLETAVLYMTKISPAGKTELQKSLPKLTIR